MWRRVVTAVGGLSVRPSAPSSLRRLVIAAAALLCAAACNQPAREAPPSAPHIAFDDPTFDFGQVEQGNKVAHEFVFHNTGGTDLAIDNVRTSCGCTAAVTSAKVIPPGQSGTIRATFDTSNVFGKKRKTVTVYSSDPAHAVSTLLITGEVTVDVIAQPSDVYLARIGRGQKGSQEVHIVAKDGIAATAVECNSAIIQPEMHELPGDPGGQVISVTVKAGAPLGRFSETMTVKTTSAAHPTLVVPVVGVVEGDVTTSPTQIAFGPVQQDERASQVVVGEERGQDNRYTSPA